MKRSATLLAGLLFGLSLAASAAAGEQRYISIRNTDSGWVQGVCSLIFRLDNGGDGSFGHLSIALQLTDKAGRVVGEGLLDVPPFGDSDATRSIDAATEFDCEAVEKAAAIAIIKATEERSDNSIVKLPVSSFDPQYYQPLKMAIAGH